MARDPIAGPDSGPEPPFPIKINGRIVKGFGRGSKELGIPTANLPTDDLESGSHSNITSGVYYGWASINLRGAVDASAAAAAPAPGAENTAKRTLAAAASSNSPPNINRTDYTIYPCVLSIGYNPFYENTVRSIEIHVMEKFEKDFYNAMMNLSILGFIRPERGYDSVEALIEDINTDIEVARKSLEREAYESRRKDEWLSEFAWG